MSAADRPGAGKPDGDAAGDEPPARARNAERFERQARALRENLRRRRQQRRGDGNDDAKPSED